MPPVAMSYFPAPNDWAVMYNNYTGYGTFLSAINPSGGLLQMTSNISPSAYWQILPLNGVNYIRNKAAGASIQLDLILSNQVYKPSLEQADNSATGQQWSFISDVVSSGEFWNVESAGASGVQLDTYSDTLQPFFEFGGHSGQMWSFSSVGKINDVAFSTVGGVAATASTINSAVPTAASLAGSGSSVTQSPKASSIASIAALPTSAGATSTSSSTAGGAVQSLSSNSSTHSLSTGAIAGIAVGAAIIGVLVAIGIGIFLWRRKTGPSQQDPAPAAEFPHTAEMAGDQQQYYGTANEKKTEGPHAVEIGGTPVQRQGAPAELPAGR